MDYSQYKQLEFRRKFWKIFGAQIHMMDPATEQELGVIKMKAWKLKEDIRLFTDESAQHEVLGSRRGQLLTSGRRMTSLTVPATNSSTHCAAKD